MDYAVETLIFGEGRGEEWERNGVLVGASGRGNGRRCSGQVEVFEDAFEDWRIREEGEDDHGSHAVWASERVDVQDAAQEFGPGEVAGAVWIS